MVNFRYLEDNRCALGAYSTTHNDLVDVIELIHYRLLSQTNPTTSPTRIMQTRLTNLDLPTKR